MNPARVQGDQHSLAHIAGAGCPKVASRGQCGIEGLMKAQGRAGRCVAGCISARLEVFFIREHGKMRLGYLLPGLRHCPSRPTRKTPAIIDLDDDGNPGVTVRLRMGNLFEDELHITRREICRNRLTLNSDGNLYGCVEDPSEQSVIGTSRRIQAERSNQVQTRDLLFPTEPGFR